MGIEVLAVLATSLASGFISLLLRIYRDRREKVTFGGMTLEFERLDEALQETVADVVADDNVVRQVTQVTPVHVPTTVVDEEGEVRVDQAVASLRSRLEEIEKRFPDKSEIDKIASVNDAIAATGVFPILLTPV